MTRGVYIFREKPSEMAFQDVLESLRSKNHITSEYNEVAQSGHFSFTVNDAISATPKLNPDEEGSIAAPNVPHIELSYVGSEELLTLRDDEPRIEAGRGFVEGMIAFYEALPRKPLYVYGTWPGQDKWFAEKGRYAIKMDRWGIPDVRLLPWVTIFPPAWVRALGRDHLLSAPGDIVRELDDGAVALALDVDPNERDWETLTEYVGVDPDRRHLVDDDGDLDSTTESILSGVYDYEQANVYDLFYRDRGAEIGVVTFTDSINIHALAAGFGLDNVTFDPESFPALVYHPSDDEAVWYVFDDWAICTDPSDERHLRETAETMASPFEIAVEEITVTTLAAHLATTGVYVRFGDYWLRPLNTTFEAGMLLESFLSGAHDYDHGIAGELYDLDRDTRVGIIGFEQVLEPRALLEVLGHDATTLPTEQFPAVIYEPVDEQITWYLFDTVGICVDPASEQSVGEIGGRFTDALAVAIEETTVTTVADYLEAARIPLP